MPADTPPPAHPSLPHPRITLVQLRSFEAVARLGGVVRAAAALHLAQPTVSTQLKELQSALGAAVLEPAGRGVRLTPVGQELLASARRIFDELARFHEAAAAHQGLERGSLRLAAVNTAEYFVPDLLGPFSRQHPGLAIALAVENRGAVARRLEDGSDELAVMTLPPRSHRGAPLKSWPFLENPLVVIAPAGHPLAARRSRIPLERLVQEPQLAREEGSGTRLTAEQHFAARGVAWPVRMALGSNEAIKHAVAAGLGLAVVSRHALGTASGAVRPGDLVELAVAGFPLRRMWHLVWRRDRPLSRPAQAFVEFLRARQPLATAGRTAAG